MTEVWFYHLERSSLTQALPALLERSLERGWRVCVQAGGPERAEALSDALWTYGDGSFLPHGTARDGDAPLQPAFLTDGADNPNGASVRMFVDGVDPIPALADETFSYERVIVLFDGADPDGVALARTQWRQVKEAGHAVAYWRQDEEGRWTRSG